MALEVDPKMLQETLSKLCAESCEGPQDVCQACVGIGLVCFFTFFFWHQQKSNYKKHVDIHNVFFFEALSLTEQNVSQLSAENYSHSGEVIWKKVGMKKDGQF